MDHSQFVKSITDTGLVMPNSLYYFTDEVIRRWLQDNAWVEDPNSHCKWCQHMEEVKSGFSEEQCHLNVTRGGSCYRKTLKEVFIPFLKNVLLGIYPSPDDLWKPIHRKGPIWDGFTDDMNLIEIIFHELSLTSRDIDIEDAKQNVTR